MLTIRRTVVSGMLAAGILARAVVAEDSYRYARHSISFAEKAKPSGKQGRGEMAAHVAAVGSNPVECRFDAEGVSVRLKVEFPPAYSGTPLRFYAQEKLLVLSEETARMERFVGAVAIVHYTVQGKSGKRRTREVRERVELVEQSQDMPPRATFQKAVKLVNGAASDVQLFGYDESAIAEEHRMAVREMSKASWRRVRQFLYLDGSARPFAVLEWTHRIEGIQLASGRMPELVE